LYNGSSPGRGVEGGCFICLGNFVTHIEGGTRLKVFENRVLRRIFGPKRDEVTGK
jgi:hypothetical protein